MPKSETSDKVSSLAARWLQKTRGAAPTDKAGIVVSELRTLCASLVRQDETAGKRERFAQALKRVRLKVPTKP
jgi:hypothetical protein